MWGIAALLAGMAIRPDGYRDWGNVAQWLPRAIAQTDLAQITALLHSAPHAAWHRAGYLLARGGRPDTGLELLADAPKGRGPVHLGPRNRPGRFDARFDVIDSVLLASEDALQP